MLTCIPAICILRGISNFKRHKIYSKLKYDQPVEATIKDCIIHLRLLTMREFNSAPVDNLVIELNGMS